VDLETCSDLQLFFHFVLLFFLFPSLGEEPAVDDSHVDGEQQDDKKVVQETEHAEQRLGDHVQRRDKVHEGSEEAEHDPNAEHVHEARDGEELATQVTHQGWQVPDVVE